MGGPRVSRRKRAVLRPAVLAIGALLAACGGAAPPTVTAAIDQPAPRPADYRLMWSDEFDRDGLPDRSKWNFDTSRNAFWGDDDTYLTVGRPENARVAGGNLVIEARREEVASRMRGERRGQKFTAAMLVTREQASWTYGYIEVNAKPMCALGGYSAIWLLPADPRIKWPAGGEIDVLESLGRERDVARAAVHTSTTTWATNATWAVKRKVPGLCAAFHRYQLNWTPDYMTIGIDDRATYIYRRDLANHAAWPFDKPFFLILSAAVGGKWIGQDGVAEDAFPDRFLVDYVRVYRKE